jgi:hypothetical protein
MCYLIGFSEKSYEALLQRILVRQIIPYASDCKGYQGLAGSAKGYSIQTLA